MSDKNEIYLNVLTALAKKAEQFSRPDGRGTGPGGFISASDLLAMLNECIIEAGGGKVSKTYTLTPNY